MKYATGQRSIHLFENVAIIRKIRHVIKNLITNFKKIDGSVFSPTQQNQFVLLYDNNVIFLEMLVIENINNNLLLPFFKVMNDYQKMKDVSPIVCKIMTVLKNIFNQTHDGTSDFILMTFGLKPMISNFYDCWYNKTEQTYNNMSIFAILLIVQTIFLNKTMDESITNAYKIYNLNEINIPTFSIYRSFFDELAMLNDYKMQDFFDVSLCFFDCIYEYLNNNAKWEKYENSSLIPESIPWNTDGIERIHGKASNMITNANTISDETLENKLMFQSNQTDQWLNEMKSNHPKIYKIIECEIMNHNLANQKQECNEFEKERLKKQRNHNENKLKRKRVVNRFGKRRRVMSDVMKVSEIDGFAIERPGYNVKYQVLKQSKYPKYGSLIEIFYPHESKWFLGKVVKIINKTNIKVQFFSDNEFLCIDLKKELQINIVKM